MNSKLLNISEKTEIISRVKERKKIDIILKSKKSEFLALYGRRRVGKTFLIKEHFNYKFDFYITGLANADNKYANQLMQNQITMDDLFI